MLPVDQLLKPAVTTFACPSCAALYEVTVIRLSLRDKGNARCVGCNRIMAEWDTTVVPFFNLSKKPAHERE